MCKDRTQTTCAESHILGCRHAPRPRWGHDPHDKAQVSSTLEDLLGSAGTRSSGSGDDGSSVGTRSGGSGNDGGNSTYSNSIGDVSNHSSDRSSSSSRSSKTSPGNGTSEPGVAGREYPAGMDSVVDPAGMQSVVQLLWLAGPTAGPFLLLPWLLWWCALTINRMAMQACHTPSTLRTWPPAPVPQSRTAAAMAAAPAAAAAAQAACGALWWLTQTGGQQQHGPLAVIHNAAQVMGLPARLLLPCVVYLIAVVNLLYMLLAVLRERLAAWRQGGLRFKPASTRAHAQDLASDHAADQGSDPAVSVARLQGLLMVLVVPVAVLLGRKGPLMVCEPVSTHMQMHIHSCNALACDGGALCLHNNNR